MLKIILTIGVIWTVWYFLIKKPKVTQHRQKKADEAAKTAQESPKKSGEETMVPCEKCGTYVSFHEAIIVSGRYYCSKECAGVKS